MQQKIPKIALVGRPNVGKSSLFNALIRKRKSIIDEEAGITRDRIYETVYLSDDCPVCFIDTGGISRREKHLFIEEITVSAKQAIEEADIVLFMIEAGFLTLDDEEIAEYIRKSGMDKCILVVNKVDNTARELEAFEVSGLGFQEVVFTSAVHSKGIDKLKQVIKKRIATITENLKPQEVKTEDNRDVMKIALLGRPNVGKSSLLNLILGRERSIVSPIPGTTRDVIEEKTGYLGKEFILLDTAGIRKRARVEEKVEYVSVKKSIETVQKSDVALLLVDAVDGITDQDKKLAAIAVNHYKGLLIGINKWDLVEKEVIEKEYIERMRFLLRVAPFIPMLPVSVKTGFQIERFMKKAFRVHANYTKKIPTHDLTEVVREEIRQHPLYDKRGEFKVFYVIQKDIKPPSFVIIANHIEFLTEAYKKFIQKALRDKFNYEGIPLKIEYKNRERKEKTDKPVLNKEKAPADKSGQKPDKKQKTDAGYKKRNMPARKKTKTVPVKKKGRRK